MPNLILKTFDFIATLCFYFVTKDFAHFQNVRFTKDQYPWEVKTGSMQYFRQRGKKHTGKAWVSRAITESNKGGASNQK